LLAGLTNAAKDHVLDGGGVDAAPRQEPVERRSREVDGMPVGESTLPPPSGGASNRDDVGFRLAHMMGSERCEVDFILRLGRRRGDIYQQPVKPPSTAKSMMSHQVV
jgi:hypothetical protein